MADGDSRSLLVCSFRGTVVSASYIHVDATLSHHNVTGKRSIVGVPVSSVLLEWNGGSRWDGGMLNSSHAPAPDLRTQNAEVRPPKRHTILVRGSRKAQYFTELQKTKSNNIMNTSYGTRPAACYGGKWTLEEEQYFHALRDNFRAGTLNIPNGTTLRCFLAEKLGCKPKRITKKVSEH
jgi:hypothetical protein